MHTDLDNSLVHKEGDDVEEESGIVSRSESSESFASSSSHFDIGLLNLPNLIFDKIFNHLSPTDILTLRLTCKSTKACVEHKFLDKLCINVKTRQAFVVLLNSQTTWTHFNFHWKLSPPQKQLSQFTLIFSEHITTLKFTSNVYDSAIIKIICSCASLSILVVEEIDGTMLAELPQKDKARLSKACYSLQHLGIHEILSDDKKGADFFIEHVLSVCCSTLKSLVVPFLTFSPINAYPFKYGWDNKNSMTSTTPTDVLVVRPLIEIIENRVKAPNLESVVVVPESRSALSDSGLFCLTLLCYHRHLNLIYDKFHDSNFNLGKLTYSLSSEPSMQMSEIASKIMTVMASTTDLLLNYEFANLRKLVVQFSTFHIDQDIFVVQNFPRLNTLNIDFKIRKQLHPRCSKVKRMDMFVQGLLEVSRPSVKQLQVQNHCVVESAISFNVVKVVKCFCNLRSLSLIGFKGATKDFPVMWRGLRLLEKVELENCPGLNDQGMLGEDWTKPAILELTDLRELKISRSGRITDLSYIIALCRMRLTRFHHQPFYQSDITFEGYNALARGDFSKTIKFLSGGTTFGRLEKSSLREYLNNFPSLQETDRKKILRGFSRWNLSCF